MRRNSGRASRDVSASSSCSKDCSFLQIPRRSPWAPSLFLGARLKQAGGTSVSAGECIRTASRVFPNSKSGRQNFGVAVIRVGAPACRFARGGGPHAKSCRPRWRHPPARVLPSRRGGISVLPEKSAGNRAFPNSAERYRPVREWLVSWCIQWGRTGLVTPFGGRKDESIFDGYRGCAQI
jgi:hypothetical protein